MKLQSIHRDNVPYQLLEELTFCLEDTYEVNTCDEGLNIEWFTDDGEGYSGKSTDEMVGLLTSGTLNAHGLKHTFLAKIDEANFAYCYRDEQFYRVGFEI